MASKNLSLQDLTGYDHQFVAPPPDELLCLICTLVARDPQQTICCGKVYCKACVDELAEHSNKCPQCREEIKCFPDKRSDRNIKSLKCKCDNSTSGCEWEGELRHLEEHLITTCDYSLLPCPNECRDSNGGVQRILRKGIEKHMSEECPRRDFACPHCGDHGEYLEMTTKHLEECPLVRIPCPNSPKGCSNLILRSLNISEHLQVCEFETVTCKYADIGCQATVLRKAIEEHENNSEEHLRYAVKTVHENKMALEANSRQHECAIAHLHSVILAQSRELYKLRSAIEDSDCEIEVDKSECDLNQMSANVLRFTNFAERKSGDEVVYSPAFYSSPGGYKMCLGVYANGTKDGKSTHISVYVYLMRGENDDHVSWPLKGKVYIRLLNQLSSTNHHRETITFRGGRASQRVVDGDRATNGSGHSQFISHASLAESGTRRWNQHQYLKDDCLYFRYVAKCEMSKPWLGAASDF